MADHKPIEKLYQTEIESELPPTPEDILSRVRWLKVTKPPDID